MPSGLIRIVLPATASTAKPERAADTAATTASDVFSVEQSALSERA